MAGGGINFEKALKSPKVAAAVQAKAVKVQKYWQSISPIFGDKPPKRATPGIGAPGDYINSITVVPLGEVDGAVRVRVKATDWKAKWIEFGGKHMPVYAPMAKTKAKFRK